MRPVVRAAVTAGAIVVVGILALAARTLTAFGVFTDVKPGFDGVCRAVAVPSGPEDIAIDRQSGLAFISVFDRRAAAAKHWSAQDGIYVLNLNAAAPPLRLAGVPKDFHPHGISLYRDPAGLVLMAINHRADGSNAVDMFDVKFDGATASLVETGSIEGGELVSPNAIAALDRTRFFVTNDHTSRTAFGRMLDDDLILARANVLFFNGMSFRPVANGLNFPSGLAISPDGHYLYVTEAYVRRLDAFTLNPVSGGLTDAGTLSIPSDLDNLRFDDAGRLWVGSHPKAFAMASFRADSARPAPSEIFAVTLAKGAPQSATPVFADDGTKIGGSSVAAVLGHRLLIGSPLDRKILDCTMTNEKGA